AIHTHEFPIFPVERLTLRVIGLILLVVLNILFDSNWIGKLHQKRFSSPTQIFYNPAEINSSFSGEKMYNSLTVNST
ncbi:MAG: hypothetical protein ACYC6H_11240, partial [Bellilinea sp.]